MTNVLATPRDSGARRPRHAQRGTRKPECNLNNHRTNADPGKAKLRPLETQRAPHWHKRTTGLTQYVPECGLGERIWQHQTSAMVNSRPRAI